MIMNSFLLGNFNKGFIVDGRALLDEIIKAYYEHTLSSIKDRTSALLFGKLAKTLNRYKLFRRMIGRRNKCGLCKLSWAFSREGTLATCERRVLFGTFNCTREVLL